MAAMPDETEGERPSKTQRKREMHELFDLGKELVELSVAQLETLPLEERLHEEILICKGITKHGARKRQLKLISKLLRNADIEGIREGVEGFAAPKRQAVADFHRIERWRDRLIEEGEAVATEFIDRYPEVDRQMLHQLLRTIGQSSASTRGKRAKRELFQLIHGLISPAPKP